MLNLFTKNQAEKNKDPIQRLKDQYTAKLAEAVKYKKDGDYKTHSVLCWEADDLLRRIETFTSIQ